MNTSVRLDETQAAAYLGLARKTLQKRRFLRQDPVYLKLGRKVMYDSADLDDFLAAHRVNAAAAKEVN